MASKLATAIYFAALVAPCHAQQFGGGSGSPFGNGNGDGDGFDGFNGDEGFDSEKADRIRNVHGILGALAFVILFPVGSVLMRVLPGRLALWAHALFQVASYGVYIASAGLGIYLVQEVQLPFGGGSMLTNSNVNYHPIIGLVVLAMLFFQPALGIVHHVKFKKLGRRQIWSHLHLFNGRAMITLGIINGGLGLYISGASDSQKKAYAIVAAVLWALWMLTALFGEVSRCRATRKQMRVIPQAGQMKNM